MVWNGVKKVGTAVVNVVKKIGRGIKRFFSWFGHSAFILDEENGMILGYIKYGKGGRELYNERYIIEQFGPIVTVNAISNMANYIHSHYKTCIHAQDKLQESDTQDKVEIDGEEESIEDSLDDLKEKANELSSTSTIMADKMFVIKNLLIQIDQEENSLLLEWFTYNPEDEKYYNEDRGDIEYHIKIVAVVLDHQQPSVVKIYNQVFVDISQKVKNSDIPERNEEISEEALKGTKEDKSDKITMEASSSDSHVELCSTGPPSNCIHQSDSTEMDTQTETAERNDELCKDTLEDIKEDTFQEINMDVFSSENNGNDVELCSSEQPMDMQISNEEEISDNHETEENHISEDSKTNSKVVKKRITCPIGYNFENIKEMLGLHVTIQPSVSLEVRMLPPDKIATDEYMIDPQRFKDKDTSWMSGARDEIIKNGRINDITIKGQKMSVQHLVSSDSSLSTVSFNAHYHLTEESLLVSGEISPQHDDAKHYLVQLIDENDLTIVIKQLWLPSQEHVNYTMDVAYSDIPPYSSGPYSVSVLATSLDSKPCSKFTRSEARISRYHPPGHMQVALPDLDSSNSDTITLEWKHPQELTKPSIISEDEEDSADSMEEDSLTHEKSEIISHNSDDISLNSSKDASDELPNCFYSLCVKGTPLKRLQDFKDSNISVNVENVDTIEESFLITTPIQVEPDSLNVTHEFHLQDILAQSQHENQAGILFQCQIVTKGSTKLPSKPAILCDFILLPSPIHFSTTAAGEVPGLNVAWEYCAHAVQYRLELVDEKNNVAFLQVIESMNGSHGKINLSNSDLKEVSSTAKSSDSYKFQIYSVGFGQDLIRCLKPSVADGKFHFIHSSIEYLDNTDSILVRYVPAINTRHTVKLYLKTPSGKITYLAADLIDSKANKEVKMCFHVKKLWHLIKSGNSVHAWIYCSTIFEGSLVTYIGVPQEDAHVLNSPQLKGSISSNINYSVNSLDTQ